MSTAAQIGLRRAYRPSIVSLNGRVLAIGRSVFAHGPSAAIIRISARLGSYKSLGNSTARHPPAATMPTSMGNKRRSDGAISSEPFEQIRSNLCLRSRRPRARRLDRGIGRSRKVEGLDLGVGKPASEQRPHRAAPLIHIGDAARRPNGNSAHEIQRRPRSDAPAPNGRSPFRTEARSHSLDFGQTATAALKSWMRRL